MSDPFIGEIRMFAGPFAPRSWAFCDGQLLTIAQNQELFSLFGTTYGGDGVNTFAVPDMRGRVPMHFGSGPGLSPRDLGARFGTESVTLTSQELAPHTHGLNASSLAASPGPNPSGAVLAPGETMYSSADTGRTAMSPQSLATSGQSEPHDNLMPYQCVSFIVALKGLYPPRS